MDDIPKSFKSGITTLIQAEVTFHLTHFIWVVMLHLVLNLTIAGSYFTISMVVAIGTRHLPEKVRPFSWGLVLFVGSCGVGHLLDGLGAMGILRYWHIVTAAVSVTTAGLLVTRAKVLFDTINTGQLILKFAPSGIGLFRVVTDGPGIDLLWEACSDSAASDIGFDPLRHPTLLSVGQPKHSQKDEARGGKSLLDEYLAVIDLGEPILDREIEYGDPNTPEHGWFVQNVIPVSRKRVLITWNNISSLKQAQAELYKRATTDLLTGTGNRNALAEQSLNHFAGGFYVDLDRFKGINDTLGHSIGDALLKAVVDRIQATLESDDRLFRLGGDEFLILIGKLSDPVLVRCSSVNHLSQRAQTLLQHIQQSYWINDREIRIDASIGVVDASVGSIEALVQAGDIAMYAAKKVGGRVVTWSPEMIAVEVRRESIERELCRIRDRYDQEFELHYQPIIDLDDPTQMIGVEALLRWNSAELGGWIAPSAFIPIAEKSGEIYRISRWVMHHAVMQAKHWNAKLKVSINVSPWDLEQEGFVHNLGTLCQQIDLPTSSISLEITERAIARDLYYYQKALRELSALNIALKIDDFGTGDSGLQRLLDARWESVKVDRSLVPTNGDDINRIRLCRSIIQLSKDMKLMTIIEGIETKEQLELMQSLGADAAQGFYIGRPVPESSISQDWTISEPH